MTSLALTVIALRAETASIRSIVLARNDGSSLPGWTPGSHLKVELPQGNSRSYSLIHSSSEPAAMTAPTSYRLGIRLEEPGRGGSRYMHALKVGDVVYVSPPENRFPLRMDADEIVLLAGGIGITPLLSMAAALDAAARPFRIVYAGRSHDQLAFLPELAALTHADLTIHTDDHAGLLDVTGLMQSLGDDGVLYVCGPLPLIEAVIGHGRANAFADGRIRFELFAEPVAGERDTAFEVVLADTGRRVGVARDQTILQALIAAGEQVMFDCERGDCGMCQMRVLEGIPDHRDYYLSDAERASNALIQVCVSRSQTPLLVLEMQT